MILEIVTPEKMFYRGEAEIVHLPGANGYFSVLQNHAPMIALLKPGVLRFKLVQKEQVVQISSGFMRIHHNVVTVCVENAEMVTD